ncbi:MAG: hypothetical protein KBE36_02605 [Bacteroides sp.]|nr:hypothetical protein [Bacteroides sp.]
MKRLYIFLLGLFLVAGTLWAQSADSDWQNRLDRIKELITTNPQQASDELGQLIKGKNKKDPALLVAVARVYFDAMQITEAQKYLEYAKKANNKFPGIYVLEGDIALTKQDAGTACQFYEQAIYFDSNCKEAYLKYAQVYKDASPEQAIDKLLQLKEMAPDYLPVYKALANIYYSRNRFSQAIEAYSSFIHTTEAKEDDMVKYAFALFLNHDFEKSLEVARMGVEKNAKNTTFYRLIMYNLTDLKKYDEGIVAADSFFNHPEKSDFTYLDYMYYGHLLSESKKYNEAIAQYQNALKLDTTKIDLWREISSSYESLNDYTGSIEAYTKYLSLQSSDKQTPDLLFQLGKLYYGEGTTKSVSSAEKITSLQKADSVFTIITQKAADSYLGYFWRARTNSALDPETTQGLAKPYYESVISLLASKNDARYNSVLVECYSYLGYYCLVNNAVAQSKEFWNKILAIDPANATAKKALEGIK